MSEILFSPKKAGLYCGEAAQAAFRQAFMRKLASKCHLEPPVEFAGG
jgi:hypothetical protein